MKILSTFAHPHVLLNMVDILSSVEHRKEILNNVLISVFSAITLGFSVKAVERTQKHHESCPNGSCAILQVF